VPGEGLGEGVPPSSPPCIVGEGLGEGVPPSSPPPSSAAPQAVIVAAKPRLRKRAIALEFIGKFLDEKLKSRARIAFKK
jgi:hypothetical protein